MIYFHVFFTLVFLLCIPSSLTINQGVDQYSIFMMKLGLGPGAFPEEEDHASDQHGHAIPNHGEMLT